MTHRWHRCCNTLADVRERCSVDPATGCWHWLGTMTKRGSPRIYAVDLDRSDKRVMPATRAVWMLAFGTAPGRLMIYRSCFVADCVNPQHLRPAESKAQIGAKLRASGKRKGTSLEQRRASVAKAMAAQGIVPTAPAVVLAIRAEPAGVTGMQLAAKYGLAAQTVSRIRRGQSHRHLLEAA